MNFQYPEDREFFLNFFAGGDEDSLEKEFSDLFDFRHPAIKRWEFNKIRKKLLVDLVEKYKTCQLKIHPDCSKDGIFQPDHIIPLSTNKLNRELRHMVSPQHQKVPAQSFGSNHIKNLTLACRRCNAHKKHRLIKPSA